MFLLIADLTAEHNHCNADVDRVCFKESLGEISSIDKEYDVLKGYHFQERQCLLRSQVRLQGNQQLTSAVMSSAASAVPCNIDFQWVLSCLSFLLLV